MKRVAPLALCGLVSCIHEPTRSSLVRLESSRANIDDQGHITLPRDHDRAESSRVNIPSMSREHDPIKEIALAQSQSRSSSDSLSAWDRIFGPSRQKSQSDTMLWPFYYVACAISKLFFHPEQKQIPLASDTIIIHLRVGDVLDEREERMKKISLDQYLADWVPHYQKGLLFYVVPQRYFAEDKYLPLSSGIRHAIVMANPYFRVQKGLDPKMSYEYIDHIEQLLRDRGLSVERRVSHDRRGFPDKERLLQESRDADEDLLFFMGRRWAYAAVGAGGFADLLGNLAKIRGVPLYQHSKYDTTVTTDFFPANSTQSFGLGGCTTDSQRACYPREEKGFHLNPTPPPFNSRGGYRLSDMFRYRGFRNEIGQGSLYHIETFPGSLAAMYLQATDDEANYDVLLDCIEMKLEQQRGLSGKRS